MGGVDVGGMTRSEARDEAHADCCGRSSRPVVVARRHRSTSASRPRARSRVDVDGMVDDAIARSREGNIFARTWREAPRAALNAEVPARVTYSKPCSAASSNRVERTVDRQPVDATGVLGTAGSSRVPVASAASRVDAPLAERAARERDHRAGAAAASTSRRPGRQAEGHERHSWPRSTRRRHRRPRALQAAPLQEPQAGQDLQDRRRPGRARDARRALPHRRTRPIDPAWHVPQQRLGGQPGRQGDSRRRPENPLKARWLGIFDGAGIHGTTDDGSLGTRRVARLHPHGDPGRRRAVRPGAGRRAGLHRLSPA